MLTIPTLKKHWTINIEDFSTQYIDWNDLFSEIIYTVSRVCQTLQGRKKLAENCSYLLLSKAINHTLSSFSLLEKGLCVDAALCARNGVETFLLLELCLLDPSEKLFHEWSIGKEFRPIWVREQLKKKTKVEVRDVIIIRSDNEDDTNRFIYSWLSEITHANLTSLNYNTKATGKNSFIIDVGGNIKEKRQIINAIFKVMCFSLHKCSILCSAIFNLSFLEKENNKLSELFERIDKISFNYMGIRG